MQDYLTGLFLSFLQKNQIYFGVVVLTHIFFPRYVYTLLRDFVPLALLIPPVLIPLNIFRGETVQDGIRDLDRLSWANVSAMRSNVYWAHLTMAVVAVVYICFVIYNEFLEFIRVRQKVFFRFIMAHQLM